MKNSLELEILIESVKVSLLGQSVEVLKELLIQEKTNWQRLEKLAIFHAIRPILFDAFQRADFVNSLSQKLEERTRIQSIFNLATTLELHRVLALLEKQEVRVLPYKGVLFIRELYKNLPLRETHDLDLLVHPKDAQKALEILLEDGYCFSINNPKQLNNAQIITEVLQTFDFIEVGLDKKTEMGLAIHIDFHWHIKENVHDFKVNYDEFFIIKNEPKNKSESKNSISEKTIFIMLLVHHGGRECWTRLKHFCDLIAFLKTTSLNKQELQQIAKELEMERFFDIGLELYHNEFLNDTAANRDSKTVKKEIINYWEIAQLWLRLDLRIRFTFIYLKLLDRKMSFLNYISKNYRYFSTPNLIENPRLITFPAQYPFLNFASKVVTFIWKKTILTIFYNLKTAKRH